MTDGASYSAAEIRDLDVDELHDHVGFVSDPELSRTLSFVQSLDVEAPPLVESAIQSEATVRTTEALDAGHAPTLSYATGMTERSMPVDLADAVAFVEDSISSDAYVATFSGHMNSAKTGAACWWLDRWRDYWTRLDDLDDHPESYALHVATNSETIAQGIGAEYPAVRVHVIQDFESLQDWADSDLAEYHDGDVAVRRLALLDEMSSHLDAHTNQDKAVMMKKWLLKMAKFRCVALLIGHTGIDIHKEIRRLVLSNEQCEAVHKPEKKKAALWDGIEDDLPPTGHRWTLDRLPESRIDYDPDDWAPWSWS